MRAIQISKKSKTREKVTLEDKSKCSIQENKQAKFLNRKDTLVSNNYLYTNKIQILLKSIQK